MKKMNICRCALAAMMMYILALSCEEMEAPGLVAEDKIDTTAPVYHFSIPAAMGAEGGTKAVVFDGTSGITSKFLETDKIYVYNVTKNAWARLGDGGGDGYGYLQPSALENEGKSCTLTGDLSFYTWDSNNDFWKEAAALESTDTYNLYYQAKEANDVLYFVFIEDQFGTQSTVSSHDYAQVLGVTMTLNGSTLSLNNPVSFKNYGSLFRQRLSFTGIGSAPTSLRYLRIKKESGGKLISTNYLCSRIESEDVISVFGNSSIMDENGDVYFALAVDETDPPTGNLIFEAADYNGNYYSGSKALPTSGLQNGKYYYGDLELAYDSHRDMPVVTDSNGDPVWPDLEDNYRLGDGATISGDSDGFSYVTKPSVTVTLAGKGTANYAGAGPFLISYLYYDLTVILDSDYTINCPNATEAICSASNLHLKTSGGTYTLTVTSKPNTFGLFGGNNYNSSSSPSPSSLAADENTTVSFTSDTPNGDGTHTYVYTVTTTHPVSLAAVTTTDSNGVKYYAAQNGDIINGSLSGDGYITIADGATVTLNIENFSAPYQCDHAPIHCLGDANIILAAGMNAIVMAGHGGNYPAVFVPEGKTLTISGTGELAASGQNANAAGIGGGYGHDCGNIIIAGGVITAYCGGDSAGIGSGSGNSCGKITISGGAIKEARYLGTGFSNGVGIGSGSYGSCGDITISGGQIGGKIGGSNYDGAVAGQNVAGIGSGLYGSCGTITIGTGITYVRVTCPDGLYNLIGGYWSNPCDVYFGDLKVYDKTTWAWYNNGTYDADVPNNGNYGGLNLSNCTYYWALTPVTP